MPLPVRDGAIGVTALETVPVPACPPGATEAPLGVAPGRLASWRIGTLTGNVTVTLGHTGGTPWVNIHTGPLGPSWTPDHADLAGLGALTTAVATAHSWLARWQPEGAGQGSLFEEATR